MAKKRPIIVIILCLFLHPATSFAQTGELNISALVILEQIIEEIGGTVVVMVDHRPPQISDIQVKNITRSTAEISWKTDEPAISYINYGETQSYGKAVVGKDFLTNHGIILEELSPDTLYHFEIKAIDKAGNESSFTDIVFRTLSEFPANIINFEAAAGDSQIQLSWQNPIDSEFKGVRITRSKEFYPSNPFDGDLIYDGDGTVFTDTNLENGVRYYYTAFAYDFAGNFASGAIASAVPQKVFPPEEIPPEIPPPPEEIPPVTPPPPEVEKLTIEDFDFWQKGKKLSVIEGKIRPEEKEQLTISIDYEKIPEVLKTIMVTLGKEEESSGEPKTSSFSFLLRINKDKTRYLATIAPLDAGDYSLIFTVLDYRNQTIKKIIGSISIRAMEIISSEIPCLKKYWLFLFILLGIIILILISRLIKKINRIRKSNRYKKKLKPVDDKF